MALRLMSSEMVCGTFVVLLFSRRPVKSFYCRSEKIKWAQKVSQLHLSTIGNLPRIPTIVACDACKSVTASGIEMLPALLK